MMWRLHLLLANLLKTQLAAKTPSRRDFASILDLRMLARIPQAKHQRSPLAKLSLGLLPVPALQAKLLLGRCPPGQAGFLVECILAEHLHVGRCCCSPARLAGLTCFCAHPLLRLGCQTSLQTETAR
jgi:hypothetical protein